MTARTRRVFRHVPLIVALSFVLAVLVSTGPVWAYYLPDGTKPDGAGGYINPGDGMCVIGIKLDGTMFVDWSITNARDCAAWTKSADGSVNLVSLDTSDKCTKAGFAGNDGYKHAWSTSLCYDTVNSVGISRVDLDNTDAMCFSKGGTVVTTGKCVAYGWVYLNRKADNTLPVTGTGVSTTTGVQAADNLGFCATSMRMTSATFNSAATCPSKHNARSTADPVGGPYTEWPDCLSSTTGCQTQASYDAGLGWSWDSTNSRCLYSYGVTGIINAAATKADGTTYAAASTQDLTTYTTQGACLANGFTWDNWLPVTPTTLKTNASGGDYTGMPAGAVIRKLDALTAIKDGGGQFYSSTGAVCQKCHSDQSRSYMERDKPGYPKTAHKLAGDAVGEAFQPYFTAAASSWGLQGVQCTICHSTARPAQDDLTQIIPAGIVGPPAAGAPKSATGHNQTEYGSHVNDICYTCHGTAASPSTTNPATVIPVSTGDFALTAKGLAPIANEFLNSPHALYTGSSTKVDIGNKTMYGSSYIGYVCRSGAGKLSSTTYPNSTTCTTAGYTWYTTTSNGNFCYYNSTSCAALPGAQWFTSYSSAAYPWAADTGGPGGVCAGVGIGSIITTVYRNGAAAKVPIVDTALNADCANPGDGSSTSGAAGFWVREGETVATGNPTDTSQGNCMTCHDVHWSLSDADPRAEPIRRECTTCHSNSGTSISGAPQVDLTTINHLATRGTPLENASTDPTEACEICHMPPSGGVNSSPMHLWRINTDSTYKTMGASRANLSPDVGAAYTNAAWVDLDHACGQCHGGGTSQVTTTGAIGVGSSSLVVARTAGLVVGERIRVAGAGPVSATVVAFAPAPVTPVSRRAVASPNSVSLSEDLYTSIVSIAGSTVMLADRASTAVTGAAVVMNPTRSGAPYYTRANLAPVASGMHDSAGVSYPVTFNYTVGGATGLTVQVAAVVGCSSVCPAFAYDWDWGDGAGHGTLASDSHTYAAGGVKSIALTVKLASNGRTVGAVSRSLTLHNPDLPPVAAAVCTWNANTWTMTVVDGSHDDGPDADVLVGDGDAVLQVSVDWGDGSARSFMFQGATANHAYVTPGAFTATEKVVDSALQIATVTCATRATPAYFTISGTVRKSTGVAVGAASVQVKLGSTIVKTVTTAADGSFTTGATLKPGAYIVDVRKAGYTFPSPALSVTLGPTSAGNTITAITP